VAISIEGVIGAPAITDSSGRFQLIAPAGELWLLIRPVNTYESRRIYLNNRETLTIRLMKDNKLSGYDEVGGLFRPEIRRNYLSAYHAPDIENLILLPNQSIDQYMQGNIPGMLATLQSGMPGAGVTINLRGLRSLYTTNQPLFIVDGLPLETPGLFQSNLSGNVFNPVSGLDPMDITNIIVLKDYQGAAMYGMRGSNGVVLIETLKPTEVQTNIDFVVRTGISLKPYNIPQLDNEEYKTLANEVLMSSGLYEEDYRKTYFPIFATEDSPEYYKYNHNRNWQKEIFNNALMNDVYLRVRGGDEIARYGLSVSYLSHNGIIKETGFNRFNVRFVGTFNVFQWLRMYISSNLVNSNSSLRESSLATQSSPILTALFKSPLLHPFQFDPNGNQLKTLEEVNSLGVSNPVAVINNFEGNSKNYRFATSFRIEANIWEEYIKWTSMLGINLNTVNESAFLPNNGMELYYKNEAWNAAKSLKNYLKTIYSDNFLSYKQEFNNSHLLTAAAGMRMYLNRFEIDWGLAKNSHERDEYKQLQNGVSYLREVGGENSRWNRLGAYFTSGYVYRDRYFINGSLTSEFSSRTGINAKEITRIGGKPFGSFFSLGGVWRISGEHFLKDFNWLEDLKLKISYGSAGNDDIGNLAGMNYYTVVHYRETSGIVPGTITDQSLKFESNKQLNTGLDISILGNKFYAAIDHYRIKTEDLLVYEPQPSFTGFDVIPSNNGEISNNGWEINIYSQILDMNKLSWEIGFNVSRFRNRVEAIKDSEVVTPFEGGQYISRVGQPILSFYGYQYNGVYATTAEALADGLKTEKGFPFGAGDSKFKDFSGPDGNPDGIINELDRTIIGSPVPELFGSISSTLNYGRWSLSASIYYVLGQEVFNYLRFQNEKMSDLSNQSAHTLNRWTTEGQDTNVPRALYGDPLGNADFSSRWIEDGSYIRLKDVTLAYTIPGKIWFLRNFRVFASATNLYTWTRYLGYDPEFSFSYYTVEQGIDYGMMPQTRKFLLGIRLGL
jgi:TonB-linked SusC/RagA family outer membrane protein